MAQRKPWDGIRESLTDLPESRLTLQEALTSPCRACATAPCCTHLPLHAFQITNLTELDHAIYVSNFDHIELGLSATGEWSIYYCYPCRFLNQQDFVCDVHNKSEQPKICVSFSPYHCWYRRVFTRSVVSDFIRIDRQRLDFIISHVVFNEARDIVQVPDWGTMVEGVTSLPLEFDSNGSEPPGEDPIINLWKELAVNKSSMPSDGNDAYSYDMLNDPCDACQAHCCKTLVFPQGLPIAISNLDYFRFCLGFPGVELGITDDVWSIIVRTTCQYLQDNRCSIYGKPERPLLCKYYDAWKCTYKIQFGLPRPPGFLRVGLEQFKWLTECFKFDQDGIVVGLPSVDMLRSRIEAGWCEETARLEAD